MFEAKITVNIIKGLNKDIEKRIIDILNELKAKYKTQNYEINYEKISDKENLILKIKSNFNTITDLLTQFEKKVKEILGKEFKNGINEIIIDSYKIEVELEENPKKAITIPIAKEIKIQNKKLFLTYDKITFTQIKDQYVEKSIRLIKDKIKMQNYEGKDEFKEYVWEGKQRKITYTGDPAVDLEKKGWIKRTDAKGQYIYGREYTALLNVIKELYQEKVLKQLGFSEMIFPKFEPWSVPMKSGHAKTVYPNAYFIFTPIKSSPEDWQDVMDWYQVTGKIPEQMIKEKTTSSGIMSYAQCPPFWPFLRNRIIDKETLPLLIFDWSGPTYRNESGGTHGLDRLEEFHRIETLFVGTKEQIVETWKKLKISLTKFYDETLDMEIKVANVTPWWMAHAGIRTASEQADVGTFDYDAYLPYRGDRSKEWLEIQNDSSNGDKYPIAFNVKEKSREYLWSGCAGNSLQRIIVAFLAQKGLEPSNWPKEVRLIFEKKVKNIKELTFY